MEENKRIKKSKSLLKQALLSLMKKKRLNKIAVKEICELAGLNRSTFYSNYEDINELLKDVHRDVFLNMSETLGYHWKIPQQTTYREHLDSLIKTIQYYQDNQDIILLLLSNNDNNLFEKYLTDYYMKLYLNKYSDFIDRYIFLYHSIGSFTLVYQWLRDKSPCSSKELSELICTMSNSARTFVKEC